MEELIQHYFEKKYKYQTILDCLEKFHNIKISRRTFFNKLKEYGLGRRRYNANDDQVNCIQQELDGSGRLLGYRAMWRKLQSHYGIYVRRLTVQTILRELDPEGSRLRKAHRLQRREYLNPGPNFCWHADGYDKLSHLVFPCMDVSMVIVGKSCGLRLVNKQQSTRNRKIVPGLYKRTTRLSNRIKNG